MERFERIINKERQELTSEWESETIQAKTRLKAWLKIEIDCEIVGWIESGRQIYLN